MNKLAAIIASCVLAGCTTGSSHLPVGDGDTITTADQQAACSLLMALYQPDQSPEKVAVNATPIEHFDRSSTRQLEERLIRLRARKSMFQFSLDPEESPHRPTPSQYFKANYFPSSGRFQLVAAFASQPGNDLEVTVRHLPDGSRIFDCLWLQTRQNDFFRLARGTRVFRFFATGENSA